MGSSVNLFVSGPHSSMDPAMDPASGRTLALEALKARRLQATAGPGSGDVPQTDQAQPSTSGRPSPAPALPAATKTVRCFAWQCNTCGSECVPIRPESRCLCGHRLKEHAGAGKLAPGCSTAKCGSAKCACKSFFFVVAEGSWILRCRCKHKHIEHDAATHACSKAKCGCGRFDSPWVCNCNHPWGDHTQLVVEKQVVTLEAMMAAASLAEQASGPAAAAAAGAGGGGGEIALDELTAAPVNRWDLVKRGVE